MTSNHPGQTDPPQRHRTLFSLRGPATLLLIIPWLVGVWTIASCLLHLLS